MNATAKVTKADRATAKQMIEEYTVQDVALRLADGMRIDCGMSLCVGPVAKGEGCSIDAPVYGIWDHLNRGKDGPLVMESFSRIAASVEFLRRVALRAKGR